MVEGRYEKPNARTWRCEEECLLYADVMKTRKAPKE
jgi:hypothetical protein